MSKASRNENEIRTYKIRTVIFLIIILILSGVAIWQFVELQRTIKKLQDSTNIIALQDSVITQQATIEKQKVELENAISLLSILVSEDDEQVLDPDSVLSGLSEIAERVREERAQKKARRKELINGLFSSSENTRETSRRNILREFSDDKNLTTRIMQEVEGKIDLDNQETIYQVIYILEQISFQSLQENKVLILEFLEEAEQAGLIGPITQPRINAIKRRINE